MRLDGRVALVTGGGTGIGRAIAERFVSEGAKVCITGRRKEVLDKVVASLPPGAAFAAAGDVTNQKDVDRIITATVSFGRRFDVLVNNAGMDQEPANVADIDPDVWRRVIDVNLTGPMLTMKASIPHMLTAGAGSIINIASLAGIRCIPNMPSYCASKGGLIMLTQQAALDFGPRNIRCNVICPGAVRTEMIEGAMGHFTEKLKTDVDGVLARFQKDVPLRRVSAPREIAALCAYLASDDSSFLTGTVIPADGGAAIVDVSGAAISAVVEG
jgi:meso-butanediol dehydrogenase / (S,S)-butanediol dehydrogenase / diacetyl reductase